MLELDIEICGCEEALSLRAQITELEATLATEARVRLRMATENERLRERIKTLEAQWPGR